MTLSLSLALHLIDCLNCNGFISIQEETVALCRCSACAFTTDSSSSRQVNGTNNSYSDRTSNDSVDLSTKWNLCRRVRQTGRQVVQRVQPPSWKSIEYIAWLSGGALASDQALHWVQSACRCVVQSTALTWIRVCSNLIWSSQSALWPFSPWRKEPLSLLLCLSICIRRSTIAPIITMCGQLTSFVSCFKAQLWAVKQVESSTKLSGEEWEERHSFTHHYRKLLSLSLSSIVSAK